MIFIYSYHNSTNICYYDSTSYKKTQPWAALTHLTQWLTDSTTSKPSIAGGQLRRRLEPFPVLEKSTNVPLGNW